MTDELDNPLFAVGLTGLPREWSSRTRASSQFVRPYSDLSTVY
jgi:hypothetical protein